METHTTKFSEHILSFLMNPDDLLSSPHRTAGEWRVSMATLDLTD